MTRHIPQWCLRRTAKQTSSQITVKVACSLVFELTKSHGRMGDCYRVKLMERLQLP